MNASGMGPAVYGTSAVKEEPAVESTEDPLSPASSPPRKRYRLMAASLPSSTPPSAFPPNGSGIGGDHQQLHQQAHQQQHQHQNHDWHRNHRSDHHHPHSGYGQPVWPNAGWINTSYSVGLAQLEETGYDSPDVAYDRDSSFSPLIGLSIGRASSPSSSHPPNHVQQRRLLLRRKQHQPTSLMDSTDSMPSGRYQSTESIQRVPDVCITMPPELSPLGYVLTPAPTPPDAEDAPSLCYQQGSSNSNTIEVEQRVPASHTSETDGTNSSMSFINAAVLSGQHEMTENQPIMLLPTNRHYLYHAANTPSVASTVASVETARDSNPPTSGVDYQAPGTPTSMDYPKP